MLCVPSTDLRRVNHQSNSHHGQPILSAISRPPIPGNNKPYDKYAKVETNTVHSRSAVNSVMN